MGQEGSKMGQDGPKMGQDGPNMGQDGPKMARKWPQDCSKRPRLVPRWLKMVPSAVSFVHGMQNLEHNCFQDQSLTSKSQFRHVVLTFLPPNTNENTRAFFIVFMKLLAFGIVATCELHVNGSKPKLCLIHNAFPGLQDELQDT